MKPTTREEWLNRSLEEILEKREEFDTGTSDWNDWNELKAEKLELLKPTTKEEIIYFEETVLLDLPEGLSEIKTLPHYPFATMKRSLLEYHPEKRHPIPYAIVKFQKYYFFILRENASGELRLIGKKGMLGGHVGKEDVDTMSLNKTLLNGLRRELHEEAGITDELIRSIQLKGLLKSNEGVDADHLGVIYEIELATDNIASKEDALSGIWIHESELEHHANSFESWASMIYKKWLKQ